MLGTLISFISTFLLCFTLIYVYWDWKKALSRDEKTKAEKKGTRTATPTGPGSCTGTRARTIKGQKDYSYIPPRNREEVSPLEMSSLKGLWQSCLPTKPNTDLELKANSLVFMVQDTNVGPGSRSNPILIGTIVALVLDQHDIWGKFSKISNLPNLNTESLILHNICVHPQYRRRGVARTLLKRVLLWATSNKKHKVVLFVNAENAPAMKLYQSMGFVRDKNYFPDQSLEREIMMIKDLHR